MTFSVIIMKTMNIGVLSANYKTTAVEIREQLAISEEEVKDLIIFLKGQCQLEEVMILSTCNRIEIYFRAENLIQKFKDVTNAFFRYLKIEADSNFELNQLIGQDAIQHIFRVTASLEAMVIGEPQITGQVKSYFQICSESGGCGFFLTQIMNRALLSAKRVRSETEIAKFAVSISFAAVELAKKIFLDLREKVILIVGAGEMAELAVTHLLKAGCSHLLVTNRTFSRAVSLAEQFNGSAVRFEYMADNLETADIIISSTGSKDFIIRQEMIHRCMKKRKGRPMFLIDIAVPRDIDPNVNEVGNAYVYDIDDLQSVVDANLKNREMEAEKAQLIIEQEVKNTHDWMATLNVVPTIKQFRKTVFELADDELDKGLKQLGDITPQQEQKIRAMVQTFANKVLHSPMMALKQKAKEGTAGLEYIHTVNELFNLTSEKEEQSKKKVIRFK